MVRDQKYVFQFVSCHLKIPVYQKLFGFLLEYVGEVATRTPPELCTVDKLIP